MLRRGKLRKRYGDAESDRLCALAEGIAIVPEASPSWLDVFAGVPEIDPGEAQIYALAAERGLMVLTGDKRALRALASVTDVHSKLGGKIVTIEAALLGLVGKLPESELRTRGKTLASHDEMAKAVFKSEASSLGEALDSYLRHVETETKPLKLWRPTC
jgi:hypothetical protein